MNRTSIAACLCLLLATSRSTALAQQAEETPAKSYRMGSLVGRMWDRSQAQPSAKGAPVLKKSTMNKSSSPVPPPPLPEEETTDEETPAPVAAAPVDEEHGAETQVPMARLKVTTQAKATPPADEPLPPDPDVIASNREPNRLPPIDANSNPLMGAHLTDGVRYGPVNRTVFKEPGAGSRIPPVKAALSRRFEGAPAPAAKPSVDAAQLLPVAEPAAKLGEVSVSVDDLAPARTMRQSLPSAALREESLSTASAENASPAELLRAVHQFGQPQQTVVRIVARTAEETPSGLQIPEAPLPQPEERTIVRRVEPRPVPAVPVEELPPPKKPRATKQVPTPALPTPEEPEQTEAPVETPAPAVRSVKPPQAIEEEPAAIEPGEEELPTVSGTILSINYNGRVVKLSFPEGTQLNLGDRVQVFHRAFFRTSFAGELEIIDHKRGLARPVDGLSIQKLSKGDEVELTLDPVL